jgi:phasin family protein
MAEGSGSRDLPADQRDISLGKDSIMVKVEDIQQYAKEHLETVVASATTLQTGFQAIASAHGDYTKKSFEDTKSFVEKLSGVKSLDKAIEAQTEYAKSAYETFMAESQKIAGLYSDLAKQTFKPLEGMVAKYAPAATH